MASCGAAFTQPDARSSRLSRHADEISRRRRSCSASCSPGSPRSQPRRCPGGGGWPATARSAGVHRSRRAWRGASASGSTATFRMRFRLRTAARWRRSWSEVQSTAGRAHNVENLLAAAGVLAGTGFPAGCRRVIPNAAGARAASSGAGQRWPGGARDYAHTDDALARVLGCAAERRRSPHRLRLRLRRRSRSGQAGP